MTILKLHIFILFYKLWNKFLEGSSFLSYIFTTKLNRFIKAVSFDIYYYYMAQILLNRICNILQYRENFNLIIWKNVKTR